MNNEQIQKWAKEIADEQGFTLGDCLSIGTYYTKDFIRNVVFCGEYHGQPAVLKVYNDPRFSDEPHALQSFNERNKSAIIRAPKLYAHHMESYQKGWMIMESLPEGGEFFPTPLEAELRKEFLNALLKLE